RKPFSDLRKCALGLCLSIVAFVLPYFALGNVMLASIFSLVAFLVGLIVTGYYARVAVDTMKKHHGLPEWNDWKDLMMKGAYMTVLTLLYAMPLIVAFAIVLGFPLPQQPEQLDLSKISGVGLTALLVLSLIVSYIIPSAIMSYLKHDKFRYAFRAREVFGKVVSKNYFLGWIVSFAYLLLVMILFSFVPYLGSPISNFISGVTVMSIMAEAYVR
ncbi:MAG: DUF4013 domain-containing protein, partial [Candidatus Woesearchaeota archaeon]